MSEFPQKTCRRTGIQWARGGSLLAADGRGRLAINKDKVEPGNPSNLVSIGLFQHHQLCLCMSELADGDIPGQCRLARCGLICVPSTSNYWPQTALASSPRPIEKHQRLATATRSMVVGALSGSWYFIFKREITPTEQKPNWHASKSTLQLPFALACNHLPEAKASSAF